MASYSIEAETKSIKVVLIGNNDEKINFIEACGVPISSEAITDNFYTTHWFTDDCDYTLACIQHLSPELDKEYINSSNAIIYLNASPEEIRDAEAIRCQSHSTIAIDFNSIKLPAKTCLEKIEALQDYFLKNLDRNFEKKALLVGSAYLSDSQSLFHCLPKEILFNEIYGKYEKLATNKFIFFSCPQELTDKSVNENEMDGHRLQL
jgi:hypothetical protein